MPVVAWLLSLRSEEKAAAKKLWPLLPFFLASMGMGTLTYWQQHDHQLSIKHASWSDAYSQALSNSIFYLNKLIFPLNLRIIYPRFNLEWIDWVIPLSAIAAVVCGARLIYQAPFKQISAMLALIILGYLAIVSPVSGLLPNSYSQISDVADRYAYLLIPFFSVIVVKTINLISKPRFLKASLFGAIALAYGISTWSYSHVFQTGLNAWTHVLKYNPELPLAYYNLARIKIMGKDFEGAKSDLNKTLTLQPDHHRALLTLGIVRAMESGVEAAMPLFENSYRLSPNSYDVRLNLAAAWPALVDAYQKKGDMTHALEAAVRGEKWAQEVGDADLARNLAVLRDQLSASTYR